MPNPEALAIINNCDLEPATASTLAKQFGDIFRMAEEWKEKAFAIVITDAGQVDEIKAARSARLEIKALRVKAEKARKTLKEESLRRGKAIDGVANVFKFLIAPIEEHLLQQEQFVERLQAEEKAALERQRRVELEPYLEVIGQSSGHNLGDLDRDQWETLLAGAKSRHAAHLAELKAAEEERIRQAEAEEKARQAKAAAEAAERARLKAEQERLQAELARQQAAAKKAKAVADKKLAEERAKAAAEKAKADALEAAAQRQAEAVARQQKAEEAARQKAKQAPDRDRLHAYAETMRGLLPPFMNTPKAKAILAEIESRRNALAAWINTQAETL